MGNCKKLFVRLLESSEMYCSLRYEDVRGCPYHLFDARSIAMLATSCTACAIVSLIAAI